MPKLFTRRRLLAAAAPLVAAPLAGKLAFGSGGDAGGMHGHATEAPAVDHALLGHAAMIGDEAPAAGGPHDLDALLYPPPPFPAGPPASM